MAEQDEQPNTRFFRRKRNQEPSPLEQTSRDVMPSLFGGGSGSGKIHKEHMLASFITHIAGLVLLLWLLRVATPVPRLTEPSAQEPVRVVDPVMHLGPGSSGTGGKSNPVPSTVGNPPRASLIQLVQPTANPPDTAHLPVPQTVISLTKLLESPMIGNPLSALMTHSDGRGKGGIGEHEGSGDGSRPGSGAGDQVFTLNGGMIAPRPIYAPDPEFSEEARKTKHQGTVVVEVVIGIDGRVHHPRVVQSLGMGLDEEALSKIATWRFDPARTRNGTQVAVRANVEVHFNLY